ncbi:14526_t:CDS:1, partial [Acaulospora morrowiae]
RSNVNCVQSVETTMWNSSMRREEKIVSPIRKVTTEVVKVDDNSLEVLSG